MVYTTYKNGDDWGMVNMALFYPHYHINGDYKAFYKWKGTILYDVSSSTNLDPSWTVDISSGCN